MKVARNEKRKKLLGFSFYINIGIFEGFLWNLTLSAKLLFLMCVFYFTFLQSIYSIKIQFIHLEYIHIYKHEQMLLGRKKLYRFSWNTIGKNLKKCYENVCLIWRSFPKARLKHWFWHLKYIIKECIIDRALADFGIFVHFLVVGNILFFIFTAYIPIIYMIDSYIYAAHIYWMKSHVSSKYMYVVEVEQHRIFFINEFIVDVVMWN